MLLSCLRVANLCLLPRVVAGVSEGHASVLVSSLELLVAVVVGVQQTGDVLILGLDGLLAVLVHGPHDAEDGLGEDAVLLVFVHLGGFAGDVELAVQVLDLEFLEGFSQSEHGVGQFLFDELLVRSGVEAGLTVAAITVSSVAAAISSVAVSGGGIAAEGNGVEEGDEATGESGGGDHVGGGGVEAEGCGGGLPDTAGAGLLLLVDGGGVGDGEQADAGDE